MYVTPDLYNWTLYFIFKFVYFSGKGLESNISKEVLPLNQPFSPLSSPLKKRRRNQFLIWIILWTIIFPQRNKNSKICMWWKNKTKKKLYLLSVQLCLVRCEKNPEPRFSRERIKKKSPGTPLPLQKKSTSLAFFLSERKKIITLCKNGSFRWRIYGLP